MELLRADGVRHIVRVLVHTVDQLLRFGIIGRVDAVAAGQKLLYRSLLAQIIFVAQIVDHISVDRVHKVGIGVVIVYSVVLRIAVRAEICVLLLLDIFAAGPFKAAITADVGLLVITTVMEDHLLCFCSL